eukprot:scaffold20343_cov103-Isochrysis_galbana.AAC.7
MAFTLPAPAPLYLATSPVAKATIVGGGGADRSDVAGCDASSSIPVGRPCGEIEHRLEPASPASADPQAPECGREATRHGEGATTGRADLGHQSGRKRRAGRLRRCPRCGGGVAWAGTYQQQDAGSCKVAAERSPENEGARRQHRRLRCPAAEAHGEPEPRRLKKQARPQLKRVTNLGCRRQMRRIELKWIRDRTRRRECHPNADDGYTAEQYERRWRGG